MTEQQLKEMVIQPKDPVAYPRPPKRPAMARRPVFRVVEEAAKEGGKG